MAASSRSKARGTILVAVVLSAIAAGVAVRAQVPAGADSSAGSMVDGGAATLPKASSPAAQVPAAFRTLTPQQQKALAPLASHWGGMRDTQRRKWLEMVRNFHAMPPAEQERLHGRMAEWANLSYEQRTQARMSFAEASKLDPGQKKARWEAYQALSPEERSRLTEGHTTPPTGAARAVRPVPPQRLATLPPAATPRPRPTIGVPSSQFDQKTLLPQHIAAHPAARVAPAPASTPAPASDMSATTPTAPVPAEPLSAP
ncbi:DUF3106 domain-containing protein [Xylophilus ampelinus]|uniref:Uncharacterized protein DUF3106 n=1 Tax=Xylophilus ampelinus TaxID=54067 RepID=A0A318SK60_9BURK|nr:DUF3106 domain-containing protein [Xylophilus ampelinus]MCS4508753.1 DUF3106 domain-containing protein [Xylophilus ampelinus]PYE79323.1 uncharacterized protein DUF3106 [Xylophilus ampelinus]